MRRRIRSVPSNWPAPPPELVSGRIEDWTRPEDWSRARREVGNPSRVVIPALPTDVAIREHVWTYARLRWNRARWRWLDEHGVSDGRGSEAVPFRWPSGEVEECG